MIDVKNKLCEEPGCDKRPSFGLPGNKPEFCSSHKKDGYILNPTKKCKTCKKEIAIYGLQEAEFCEEHHDSSIHFDYIQKLCDVCKCMHIIGKNNECVYQTDYFKRYKVKEMQIKQWLDINGYVYISHDKCYDTDCGKERPDFIFESLNKTHIIILEVDENQHSSYNETCECTRMINISQGIGMPTIFIRYNPDSYKTNDKKRHDSYINRMKCLGIWLDYCINIASEEIYRLGYCSFIQLYYDHFDISNIVPQTLTEYL